MDFVERRNPAHEGIVWHIYVPLKSGTASVNHIARTNCEGEDEFLFAPYSAFTVLEVEWGAGSTMIPHEVHINMSLWRAWTTGKRTRASPTHRGAEGASTLRALWHSVDITTTTNKDRKSVV